MTRTEKLIMAGVEITNEAKLGPATDPAVAILKDGMNQSFVHGFECGKTRAQRVILNNLGVGANDLIALIDREQAPELPG